MSDNSSGTNSWTFLTSEVKEPVVESVGLLARGDASSLGSPQLQTEQLGPDLPQAPDPPDSQAEQTHGPEPPQVAPLESGDDAAVLHATILKADPGPSGDPHVENLSSLTSDPDDRTPSDHGKDDLASDAHVFSDACAPPSPCPGPASAPDGVKEAEECLREGKELKRTLHEDFTPGFESLEEEENEGSGVRRRNISLLPTQHHDDEEDMEEEHPYSPPREDCFGFSLNKCIFGALVLLGLGTIFFSGVLLDLGGAGEADMGELKDPELQKAWLNSEAPIHEPVQPSEVMERLAKDGEQIAKLQAQLQQQEEKLKVQEAEGSKERMRREELEMQNQRMKEELEKLPALQKQLEQETQKVKSERAEEDLQGLPAMQKALEFLRVKIAELPQNTVPVAHSAEHKREKATNQGEKESKNKWHGKDAKEKRNEWKKGSRGAAEVEKPWMGKDGEDGDGKKKGAWRKQKVEQEEGKGERKAEQDGARGKGPNDGGKWKDGGEKRKFRQDGDKGDWRYDPKSKRAEQKTSDSGREEPKERKSSGAKAKEKERGSEQKDWNHGKKWKVEQAGGNEQKEWKGRRGEKRAWNEGKEQEEGHERGGGGKDKTKSDGKREQAQKEKSRKGEKDHHKGTGEKKVGKGQEEKRWSGRERDLSKDDASETWKDVKKAKEERHERGEKCGGKAKPGCDSLDPHQARQTHSNQRNSKDHMQDNYWSRQKERIHHYHGSTEECTGVAECAYAEGLSPVPQSDFEALMLGFLTRVLGPEEQMSKKEELNKLIGEFFINGVFIHDQIPFGEFVEDVADILEDLAEEEGDEEMEDEMEGFAREALEKFALPDSIGNEEKSKGGSG